MDAALGSITGDVRFYGLTPTSMKLEGLDRHLRLIDSYKNFMQHVQRLHKNRAYFSKSLIEATPKKWLHVSIQNIFTEIASCVVLRNTHTSLNSHSSLLPLYGVVHF